MRKLLNDDKGADNVRLKENNDQYNNANINIGETGLVIMIYSPNEK